MVHRIIYSVLCLLALTAFHSLARQSGLPPCEWCGATEAPANVSWQTTIPDTEEAGEWITISGRVFESDRKTPASGVILYVYHTNAKGIYEKKGNETGNGKRHGYLRGWMKTNRDGNYRFTTIKPASYPGRTEPGHIHITIKEPHKAEYWIDSLVFDDDPLLTLERRSKLRNRGGSGIIQLQRNAEGILVGTRNIVLMK